MFRTTPGRQQYGNMKERPDPAAPDNNSPGDRAWENDLTEEDVPDPAEREPSSHDLELDS
jgi:hypothetical protein